MGSREGSILATSLAALRVFAKTCGFRFAQHALRSATSCEASSDASKADSIAGRPARTRRAPTAQRRAGRIGSRKSPQKTHSLSPVEPAGSMAASPECATLPAIPCGAALLTALVSALALSVPGLLRAQQDGQASASSPALELHSDFCSTCTISCTCRRASRRRRQARHARIAGAAGIFVRPSGLGDLTLPNNKPERRARHLRPGLGLARPAPQR